MVYYELSNDDLDKGIISFKEFSTDETHKRLSTKV